MISNKKIQQYLESHPIADLPDVGIIWIREQPCKIIQSDRFVNQNKYEKNPKTQPKKTQDPEEDDEEEGARMRFEIVAENIFTGKETYRGLIKGPEFIAPKIQTSTYQVVRVDPKGTKIVLLNEECEEEEDIPLPEEENPTLAAAIRKRVQAGEEISVVVTEFAEEKKITDIEDNS